MDILKSCSAWFWTESFWLPGNGSWTDLERNETVFYPNVRDLKLVFPVAGFLFFIRCVWERCVALHIGRCFSMKEQTLRKIAYNDVLEHAFKTHGKTIPLAVVKNLASEAGMTSRQVERWWRKRAVHNKPTQMQRFTETSWRFLYYFLSFWIGLYVLWDKPWLWDTRECWYLFPKQHVTMDIQLYYMVQLGFYVSLIFSLCTDVRRKDFEQMMVHHFATIVLMVMSWSNNMVRVGSLVLCLHDTVDYWLEGAKLANYLHYNKVCDMLFIIFATLWFVTRLVIFPLRVLNSTWFENTEILGKFGASYVFNGFLVILFFLHVVWFYTILKMVIKFLVKGKVEKDSRSDTDYSTDSEGETSSVANVGAPFYYGTEDQNMRLRKSLNSLKAEFGSVENGYIS